MPLFAALRILDERLYNIAVLFKDYDYMPVKVEDLHLTLLFIGDYGGIYLYRIVDVLGEVEVSLPGILKPVRLSLLPPGKNTHIVVEVGDPKGLLARARQALKKHLGKHVVIRDRYGFKPHITIARRRGPPNDRVLAKISRILDKASKLLPTFIVVHGLYLYRTIEGGGYERLLKVRVKWV